MPKKKGNRGKKPARGKNEQRELEEYTQKSKCSVGSDELSTFSNLSINDSDDDEEVSAINSILQKLKSSDKEVSEFSINSILPDELLEQILVYLPVTSVIRARSVCKKWREITSSKRFLWNASQTVQQKPWFFKFHNYYEYAYNPILQKWQRRARDFLDEMTACMFGDPSDGLVCYTKDYAIHVCNPITREHKMLQEPPGLFRLIKDDCPILINISVNLRAHKYNVSLLTCGSCGELSVQIYDSETMKWATSHTEVLTGWTIGFKKSVICNRVLYFLIDSTGGGRLEHRLLAYDFSGNSSTHGTLLNSFIPLPCSDICGLMNLKGKLIIVAAIGRPWDLNNGFIIWLLKGKDWQEISRVTHTCFYCSDQIFGYRCSGADDLIYIHADYDPRLVVFDMNLKQWKDCQKCPMVVNLFDGFCILPRLISP